MNIDDRVKFIDLKTNKPVGDTYTIIDIIYVPQKKLLLERKTQSLFPKTERIFTTEEGVVKCS